jgi:hypothetical protein
MIKLPRLPLGWQNQPTLFERYWDNAMSRIEESLNQLLDLPIIQDALATVSAAAANANAAAANANVAANSVASESSLVNSYIDTGSFTPPLISCTPLGVVTIAAHTRVYGNPMLNPSAAVSSGSVTVSSAVAGDVLRIFYSDPAKSGGNVTYQATKDPAPPPVQGAGTHSVGSVVVPSSGSSTGNFIKNPGFVEP